MTFHVDSEIGKLRQVILHRPGLELSRLTPDNVENLLFDDILWAKRARHWSAGAAADDLATIAAPLPARGRRDVFMYMISGAKVRAPAAAMAMLEQLKGG